MRMISAVAFRFPGRGRARTPLRAAARTECAPYQPRLVLWVLLAGLALPALPLRGATNDLTTTLQRGLFEEEANQNLTAAVQAYEAVASQFDKDRKLAATAIFRLGECYRKQGNTNAAATQYERILREFSDQPTLVTLSRQNLSALGSAPATPAAQMVSEAARQEQKRLLQEELKLVERQLEEQKKKHEVGVSTTEEVTNAEREVLKLKRQLAALDAGAPVTVATAEFSAAPASSEADEVRRIQSLIKDSPDLINAADGSTGETLLQSAAAKGKVAVVKVLLESGAAVDGLQQPGLTPLHYAAANGHKAVVDVLLGKGAKADAHTESGVTPLHLAARKGYESVAKALLAAGAPANAQTKDRTSFGSAVSSLRYDLGSGQSPLHLAAAAGYPGMVELLLAKGADANAEDTEGRTPLSYAAQKPAILQLLLAAHANPNAGRLNLPLALAAYYGDLPALKLLLAAGADPNTNAMVNLNFSTLGSTYPGGALCSPVFLAVIQRKAVALKELLDAKGNPNGFDPQRYLLMHEALRDNATLKVLLDGGADPNQPIGDRPPLQEAVGIRNQAAVELLLDHHAEVNATDKSGWTALHTAAALGLKEIAEFLLKSGANVNARDKDGWTPLTRAVEQRQKEMAELLLANKADPNDRNKYGQTALDLAKRMEPASGLVSPGQPGAPLTYQWRAPGTAPAAPEQPSKAETMADLLRRRGAVEDLPQPDRIMVQRRASGYSDTLLTKGTNDWNQFTVLELLAMQYGFLSDSPAGGDTENYSLQAFPFAKNRQTPRLGFPDLAHLRIRRPTPDMKGWREQVVNLAPVFESGDCKDSTVRWGDVLEIPEAEHALNQKWAGFTRFEVLILKKCLTRHISVVIKGQATDLALSPGVSEDQRRVGINEKGERLPYIEITSSKPFWLKPVLLQSKLVLTSSDLSRVKVTRPDPVSGKERQWVVDCSPALRDAPDFWLRDGDRIEVPERTEMASPSESGLRQPAAPGLAPPPPGPAEEPTRPAQKVPARTIRMSATARASSSPQMASAASGRSEEQATPPTLQRLANVIKPLPPSQSAEADQRAYLIVGGVYYSPKPDDQELLNAGYRKDRSAKTRVAEFWEARASSDLSGRACPGVWTGTELVVFGGEGMGTSFGDGARYCLAEDTWAMLPSDDAPASRTGHAMAWTGKEVIVWGGFGGVWGDNRNHNDGARYNPATDTWKPMTMKNAPEARFDLTAVWSGRELLVWGGYTDNHSRYQGAHADAFVNTGGRYNPSTDTWKPITTKGAPTRRSWNTLVWTGKEMIVWGGINAHKVLKDGGRYNPSRDTWRPISSDGAPSARGSHVAVWTGKEMIVWGGSARDPQTSSDYYENGGRYDPETDTWKPISTIGAPKGRILTTAVWTGTEMVVWGGVNDAQAANGDDAGRFVGSGARYNPATDTWKELATSLSPSPRLTCGVWTGEGLLTFGGYNGTHLNDTWFYSPQRKLYPYVKE
jgi:ankyrin repeat protein/N-acetylneuraminic acid mutarotase